MKVTVNYYRIGFDDYEDMDDLLDSDFIKKNSEPYKSYEIETLGQFEELEDEYYNADDAMYPRIICDETGNEITTGTAGMLEDWDIVEDTYNN